MSETKTKPRHRHFQHMMDACTAAVLERLHAEETSPMAFLMMLLASRPPIEWCNDGVDATLYAESMFEWLRDTVFCAAKHPRLHAVGELAQNYTFCVSLESAGGRSFAVMTYYLLTKTGPSPPQ